MKKLLLSMMLGTAFFSFANAQTNILIEDFEGGSVPATWSQITNATDGGWIVGTNTALQSQYFPIDAHTNMACTNDDACDCDKSNDILITPSLDFSSYSNVFMSFDCYYFELSYNGIFEEAKIVASTDNGVTWTDVATVPGNNAAGWQINYANLSAFAGNSNVKIGFKYNDGGEWLYGWAIDNVSIYSPLVGVDLSVSATVVGKLDARPVFTAFPKYLVNFPLEVRTYFINVGTVPVTSFDFSWTDGVNTNNQTVTGINLAPLDQYELVATVPYNTLSGITSVNTSITNINSGAVEISTTNNAGTYDVEGVTAHPDKRYFAEEATGTWCQWCPRGTVFMEYMHQTYQDLFVGVAVHNNDPMVVSAYDAGLGGLIAGYPSVVPNRATEIDPSQLEGDFIDVIQQAPPVVITGNATFNLSNNNITVDLTGTFSQTLSGDHRFMAVVVEDSVTGTTTAYAQVNSYAGGANGPMGGFELLPGTVPAALMHYDFVGRALLGGFTGQSGSLPASITSGSSHNYQFTTTAAGTWNKDNLTIAAVVIDNSSGAVLNAASIPVTITTDIKDAGNALVGSFVYPTATSDIINLSLHLAKPGQVNVTVTDVLGKVILNQDLGSVASGVSKMFWNVSSLSSGMYHLNVTTQDGKFTQKFIRE